MSHPNNRVYFLPSYNRWDWYDFFVMDDWIYTYPFIPKKNCKDDYRYCINHHTVGSCTWRAKLEGNPFTRPLVVQ